MFIFMNSVYLLRGEVAIDNHSYHMLLYIYFSRKLIFKQLDDQISDFLKLKVEKSLLY